MVAAGDSAVLASVPPKARAGRVRRLTLVVAGIVWIVGIVVAVGLLSRYKSEPGVAGQAPEHWPGDSALKRVEGGDTLVMFVHPQCPCTRASLSELNLIMQRRPVAAAVHLVFMRPHGAPSDWEATASWDQAGHIPNATRVIDGDGQEAKRFGAMTSGQLLVYDAQGERRFAGGITGSRGHEGDNAGREAVLELLAREAPTRTVSFAVFGCGLWGSSVARSGAP